jgi:sec-independent protein translocase protein TatB
VLDINGGELLVLLVVGVIVLGPERLPQYAAQLARFVRQARSFARTARDQMREELGEDFDDIDWQSLDPRRYDPRKIVRDALLEDDEPVLHEPRRSGSGSGRASETASGSGSSTPDLSTSGMGTSDLSTPDAANGTRSSAQAGSSVSGFDPDAT